MRNRATDRLDNEGSLARREFLRQAALASASTLLVPAALLGGNGGYNACAPTTADIEGPYYLAGSPTRVHLASEDEPGQKIVISGVVYANDCATPIAGALIDVWAANDAGCYNNNHECTPHGDDVYNLRGRFLSDANGGYSFASVKPGRYLNGATYRPSHIHFKFNAPDKPVVTTQLYFTGDPYIPSDPWASTDEASARIIPLNVTPEGFVGVFDIVLDVPPPASGLTGTSAIACTELVGNAPNPFTNKTTISYNVAAPVRVDLAIYDLNGRRVRTLVSSVHGIGRFSEEWDGRDDGGVAVPAGVYACRLQAAQIVHTHKIIFA